MRFSLPAHRLALLPTLALAACGPAAFLEDGDYAFDTLYGDIADPNLPDGLVLTLADGASSAEIVSVDGTLVDAQLTVRPRDAWLSGCPTNFSSDALETADWDATFDLGELSFDDPMIAAGCQGDEGVYLQPDTGELAGPCTTGTCLRFEPVAE